MRLQTLKLRNFQQIKKLDIDLDGESIAINGANETGKTTIVNALTWLLTGKAHTGEAKYSPQTKIGEELAHHLDHSVEGVFVKEDGTSFTLYKAYKEIWRRPRGALEEELTGGEYEHMIDGVPTRASDYENYISSVFGDTETVQVLSNPLFFGEELPWQRRREIVMDLIGDMSDLDVILCDDRLSELKTLLKKRGSETERYTIDELAAISKAERKKAQDAMKAIPERIDELNGMKPEAFTKDDIVAFEKEKEARQLSALAKKKELDDLKETSGRSLRDELISDIKGDMQDRRIEIATEHNEKLRAVRSKKMEVQTKLDGLRDEHERVLRSVAKTCDDLDRMSEHAEMLRSELEKLATAKYDGRTTCYACGQRLPEDEIMQAEAQFNMKLSERKEETTKAVKNMELDIASKQLLLKELNAEEESLSKQVGKAVTAVEDAESELKILGESLKSVEEDEVYKKLNERLQEALAMDDGSKENAIKEEKRRELTQALRDDIAAVNEIEETLKKQEEIERFDRRIKELEGDFVAMSQALEQAEKVIYLTELFTIVKADQLTSSINAYFDPSVLKFKLFEQLKNGGIEPTCEVLVKSKQGNYKEFRGANRAGKINAGLEIIHVLAKSYGKSIPIAIDNAEGVNRLNVRDAQVIATYVTRDPKLVIEPFDYM